MRTLSTAILATVLLGCGSESDTTQPAVQPIRLSGPATYSLTTLPGSLGGTSSLGTSINARGSVAGFSNLPGNGSRHAALWREGAIRDLGTLGGPNSNVQWPGLNAQGVVVGIAETEALDTLHEQWSCSAFFPSVTGHVCRGFIWQGGVMTPLPTLGGTNGFATGVNSRGQVVGWAETRVHDPTCTAPQVLQFRAVVWEPARGRSRPLPPFPGDSTTAATAINERGQVVGISGDCDVAVGRFSARHALLWDGDRVTDLGNLGGISWHTPMAINDRGDVVGFSNPPGDADGSFISHAFLWTRQQGMQDLGLFPGDDFSQAFAINARGQVVGRSCGASGCRAVLWEGGQMFDLNLRLAPVSLDLLLSGRAIDDAGTITGNVRDHLTNAVHTYLATPGQP